MRNGQTATGTGHPLPPPTVTRRNGRDNAAAIDALDKRQLLTALKFFKRGVFSARLPEHLAGLDGRIADTFNEIVELNERMAGELERLRQVVGTQGQIAQRASLGDVAGAWAASIESINALIAGLALP